MKWLVKSFLEVKLYDRCILDFVFGRAHWRSTVGLLLLQHFSVGLVVEYSCCFISVLKFDLSICCFDA